MRALVDGPRRSGRTHRFIESLPDNDQPVHIVAYSLTLAKEIIDRVRFNRGDDLANRCVPYGLRDLVNLKSKDPTTVFFEHTAYEQSSLSQYEFIRMIEDMNNSLWSIEE